MKKRISLILFGLILGILGFINFENLNILYLVLVTGVVISFFYRKNKEYAIFFLCILVGFSFAKIRFDRIDPKESKNIKDDFTIIDKKTTNNSFRYTIKINENKRKAFMFDEGNYEIGDRFICKGDLKLVNRNTNPNLFSYRFYAISKGIGLEFKAKSLSENNRTTRSNNLLLSFKRRITNYVNRIFRDNLSKDSADFIISVILSDSLFDRENVNKLGLAHILAVSGFHMDLLFGFMIFILSKIGFSFKKATLSTLVLALMYGYVIGFPYSILRVLIVNTINFLGFLKRRGVDRVKALMVAAIVILFINPFAVLNIGYILSFVTMFIIYKIYPRLKTYFKEGFIRERLAFTTSIQIAALPFVVYYFRYYNFLSIIANFLIVPVFELAMYIIFGLIFLYPILKILLKPGFLILDIMIRSILNMTEALSNIRFLSVEFMAESIFVSLYLFVLIFVFTNIKNKKGLAKFIKLSLAIVLCPIVARSFNKPVEYQMIDIGQGDCFLLNDRGNYYLVDVGGPKYEDYDSGERILVPYLKSLGIKDIEAIFISHEDKDHAGNLDIIMKNFKIKNIVTDDKVSKEFSDKYETIFMEKGDEYKLKSGKITCVYDGEKGAMDINDKSLGLLIDIGGEKILTLGDLSSAYEDCLNIKADILKLSHHGSASSSSKKFIDYVNPQIVLISAGRNNTYGHPKKEVLENVGNIRKYNTQTDGLVTIKFYKGKVITEKYLKGGFFRWTM